MLSDTSNAESGSDIDDFGPSFVQKASDYGYLTPVHEEVGLSIHLFLIVGVDFPFFSLKNFNYSCYALMYMVPLRISIYLHFFLP